MEATSVRSALHDALGASYTVNWLLLGFMGLGLTVAYNVVADAADQPSWQGALRFAVPWAHMAIVFVAVFAAALLTSWAPAARAARVYPAEALRCE